MLNITEGVKRTPVKCVIYGPESIGKTTLSSKFENPLIVDVENGSNSLNVRRIRCDKSWEELIAVIKEIIKANPESVEDYKNGNKKSIGFLVGQVMRQSKGKANPGMVNELLAKMLS